jgi:hypothetical protein
MDKIRLLVTHIRNARLAVVDENVSQGLPNLGRGVLGHSPHEPSSELFLLETLGHPEILQSTRAILGTKYASNVLP